VFARNREVLAAGYTAPMERSALFKFEVAMIDHIISCLVTSDSSASEANASGKPHSGWP
jgi:hypothetical protein